MGGNNFGLRKCGANIRGVKQWQKRHWGSKLQARSWSTMQAGRGPKALIEWSRNSFDNNKTKINKIQTKLKAIANRNNTKVWDEENEIKEQLKELWKREEIYWHQHTMIKSLEYGDKNSKFFHLLTIKRRRHNRVLRTINWENKWA